jgi:hypothetical protein
MAKLGKSKKQEPKNLSLLMPFSVKNHTKKARSVF